MKATFTITDPPSVNKARQPSKNGRRLISTAAYRAYQKSVAWEIAIKCRVQFSGRVRVEIVSPERRRFDIDAPIKAVLDGMEKAGIYDNDRQVRDLRVRFADIDETTITIESMEVAA